MGLFWRRKTFVWSADRVLIDAGSRGPFTIELTVNPAIPEGEVWVTASYRRFEKRPFVRFKLWEKEAIPTPIQTLIITLRARDPNPTGLTLEYNPRYPDFAYKTFSGNHWTTEVLMREPRSRLNMSIAVNPTACDYAMVD